MKIVGKFSVKTILNFLKISIAFVGIFSTVLLFSADSSHQDAEDVEIEGLDDTISRLVLLSSHHTTPNYTQQQKALSLL